VAAITAEVNDSISRARRRLRRYVQIQGSEDILVFPDSMSW